MPVIDIDSHFYEPFDWLDGCPEVKDALPPTDRLTLVLTTAFGEVLSGLPPQHRPNPYSRLPGVTVQPDGTLSAEQHAIAEAAIVARVEGVQGGHDVTERIAFLDAQGIDEQWVLPTFAFNPIAAVRRDRPDLAPTLLSYYNGWAAEQLSGTDRLLPVTLIDPKTMDRATVEAELRRSRDRGARSFVFWASPVDGVALSHPDFAWFWAAAEDLGLMPMVHVGAGRPSIDLGWLSNGRNFPSSHLSYFLQLSQLPELLLTELVFAGIFERHPRLRVLVCELGVDWLPRFLARCDRLARMGADLGSPWQLPLLPSDYVRRGVRVSPLHTDPTAAVLDQVGDGLLVFSSDYPHLEGGTDALADFRGQLAGVDAGSLAAFFGSTIADDLALSA